MAEKKEVNELLGMESEQQTESVPKSKDVTEPKEQETKPTEEVKEEKTDDKEVADKQPETKEVEEQPKEQEQPEEPTPKIEEEKPEEEVVEEKEVVTEEEKGDINNEEEKEAEKQKEEVKDDIKDKSEDYVESVIENLLEDTTKLKIDNRVIEKERDAYKERREEAMKELNGMKYDSKRIAVRDDFRPMLKALEEYAIDPKDNNAEIRALSMLYENIGAITGGDYRADVEDFYKKKAQSISKLSGNSSKGVASVPSARGVGRNKPSGVVKSVGSQKRF